MSSLISHILAGVAGGIIVEILSMFIALPRRWVFDRYTDDCKYRPLEEGGEAKHHKVTITKKFGKVIHIDCALWRSLKEIDCKSYKYKYCPFGDKLINECEYALKNEQKKCRFT